MVNLGATGFEPATSSSQTKRSTKLSYAPELPLNHFNCRMVFLRWQFAQRTSHFAISSKMRRHERPPLTMRLTSPRLLAAYMIEFEHLRIPLAAINAIVLSQIFNYVLPVLRAISHLIRVAVSTILLRIRAVQLSMISAIAIPAYVVPYIFFTPAVRKDRKRQHPRALSTGLHTNIRSPLGLACPLEQERMKPDVARKVEYGAVACE